MDLSENDRHVLAAVIRENTLIENYVTLTVADLSVNGLLTQVVEFGSGRKISVTEFSVCTGDTGHFPSDDLIQLLSVKKELGCTTRIQAADAIYEFGTKLVDISADTYKLKIVGPLSKSDRRLRVRSTLIDPTESVILLRNGSTSCLAMVRVFDFSFEALGVEIRTMTKLNEEADYFATGSISVNGFVMNIQHGPVRRLRESNMKTERGVFGYSAGLVFKEPDRARSGDRLSLRVTTDAQRISINSCLSPNFEIGIQIQDMATSGFRGLIVKPQDRHLLWTGCGIRLNGTDLRGIVRSADDGIMTAEWYLTAGKGEKIWSDIVSGNRNPHSDLNLPSAEDVMTAFVRSGTASEKYLRQLPLIGPNTVRGLAQETQYPEWYFKWIERDRRGVIKGHIAGYRVADNLWCAGDLFADPDQNQKLSAVFTKKFLEHFVDFLQRKTPVPKVYGAWKANHPFWKKIEEFLKENPETLFSDLVGYTYFTDPAVIITSPIDVEIKEVRSTDETEARDISFDMERLGVREFASALDFDPDRFGSPRTREQFAVRGFTFERHYLTVRTSKFECLAVLTRVPFGVSPYNNTSKIYVLPINGDVSAFSKAHSVAISAAAAARGIYPHRVVYLLRPGEYQLDSELLVRSVIAKPRMWLHV